MILRGLLAFGVFLVVYTGAFLVTYVRVISRLFQQLWDRGLSLDPEELQQQISFPAALVMVRWYFRRRGPPWKEGGLVWDGRTLRSFLELFVSWPFWLPVYDRALRNAVRRYAVQRHLRSGQG